jgi:hypothetical protein
MTAVADEAFPEPEVKSCKGKWWGFNDETPLVF